MSFSSPKSNPKPLTVEIQHMKSGLVENSVRITDANLEIFTQAFPVVFRPSQGFSTYRAFGQLPHEFIIPVFPPGNAPDRPPADQDVLFVGASVPAAGQANANITLNGYHNRSPATWSWYLAPERNGTLTVEASFADGTT